MITNSKRKNRIEEFVEKEHKVMTEYYDPLESVASGSQLKQRGNGPMRM